MLARMRNFKMFWDIFKKILKVEFQLRTWGRNLAVMVHFYPPISALLFDSRHSMACNACWMGCSTCKVAFYSLIVYFATSMGTHTLAAHQVMMQLCGMCTVFGEPLSQTAQSFMPELMYGVNQNLAEDLGTCVEYGFVSRLVSSPNPMRLTSGRSSEYLDFIEYAQAPCTPGLMEEPNLSKVQEASACDDHLELGEESNLSNILL
ncbi:hypothetical protein LOK49_LG01G02689 [Camellia lanceoleosa]|uniref:Uncharacterized protein n=1 Tax=Camellia lanceoleosa TaxID=1840588 RepID=A0ACC0J6N9_9ERIC|nr:hypothetical protein LOK49_LG01G02689 [Camellia lanceoleosa]